MNEDAVGVIIVAFIYLSATTGLFWSLSERPSVGDAIVFALWPVSIPALVLIAVISTLIVTSWRSLQR